MKSRFRMPFERSRHTGLTTPLRMLLATTAAFWMGAVQPQTLTPAPIRQVTELRFRDFFSLPVGPRGLELSDTLRQANGQTVSLVGYMVQQESPLAGRFMLTPRPVQMSEHADGQADDLPPATVLVLLDPAQNQMSVPHVPGLVRVSGVLGVGRHEAADGRVSWVRLQLSPEATRSMNAAELAGYLHKLPLNH